MRKKKDATIPPCLRSPIVTVLGHVDHGKTTLLDAIRKTDVASREFGGITQHIGAYQIDIKNKDTKNPYTKITFIDTPGHEAFSKMRGQGANVADIAILVVAANDGIMPQTIESINHIKAANIHTIVALNKIDLPDINIEKVKKQLMKHGLNLEEYGGDIPVIPVSAKNNIGIDKLLEIITVLADLYTIKENNPGMLEAVIIESSVSKNKGTLATVIVHSGNLKVGQNVVNQDQEFKIRALINDKGQNQNEVKSGSPTQILGWKKLPKIGSTLYSKDQTELSKSESKPIVKSPEPQLPSTLEKTEIQEEKIKLIIRADTAGTLEAITASLLNQVDVILSSVGIITESDIFLAKTTKAVVVGFNQKPTNNVEKLAQTEKVILKTYNIIYELIDEIGDVAEALKKGNLVEILGEAKVMALFPFDNDTIAGVKILKGRLARGDQVKIMRNEEEIGRTRIKTLKHLKDEVNRVEEGKEAGVLLMQKLEVLTGDSIISIG
jgi:translation initiation factor IF-2